MDVGQHLWELRVRTRVVSFHLEIAVRLAQGTTDADGPRKHTRIRDNDMFIYLPLSYHDIHSLADWSISVIGAASLRIAVVGFKAAGFGTVSDGWDGVHATFNFQ